ncbi:hypothetical protein M758_3G241000 [Ceratodon purpureus]|uniref:Uncharacterized protein n=1 Tax=Ceratodon purpureus TaxID=3225 RepID=A0A8T0IM52_CERPU|nr:hypothetical protein KC19_3G239600 [Ceratodon purpureus]KAG0624344.1 hypothetical protein M758_3G241000 [Ceratodon purpureus]
MVLGLGRGKITPLLIINFVCYLTALCLSAWGLNRNINLQLESGENFIGDYTTTWFLPVALIACMLGLASVFAGFRHICMWRADSFGVATTLSLIAWVLDFAAMGFAVKEVEVGGGFRPARLKVIEAVVILMAIFELLYFWLLQENNYGCDSTTPGFVNPQVGMYNRPNMYNQGGTPHMHHHHHGPMPGLNPSDC